MAQQRKEAADRKRLIAALQDVEVDGVGIEHVAQERDDAVDGDEQQDADDVFLLVGLEVVGRVREDEEDADAGCDDGEDAGEEEAEVVEGVAFPEWFLVDDLVLHCAVADGHGCGLRRGAVDRLASVIVVWEVVALACEGSSMYSEHCC
jgi:hypothetical protein